MLINIEKEILLKEKHIAWFTQSYFSKKEGEIGLVEVVERTYKHPSAPEYATISQLELVFFDREKRIKLKNTSHLLLLESIQQTVSTIEELKKYKQIEGMDINSKER